MNDSAPQKWPDNFDFRTDLTCQTRFKPYIHKKLDELAAYDSRRPAGSNYIFHEHAKRVAQDIKAACLHLGAGETVAENMYWALLIHDIGKMQFPPELWDSDEKPSQTLKTYRRTHTEKGARQFEKDFPDIEHPFKTLSLDIMRYHHEQMDGNGPFKMPGKALSAPIRLASIVEAYDGWTIPRPHFDDRDTSPPAVLERMKTEKSHMFDPDLLESFAEMKLRGYK